MMTAGTEALEAKEESRVNQALNDQTRVVERLEAAIDRLGASMEAVLRDPAPAEVENVGAQAPSCQLEESILSNTRRIDSAIATLDDLIARNQL